MKSDQVSWFDLWAAGEAVNAVCLWHGKEGIATHLGMLIDKGRSLRELYGAACVSVPADLV